MTAAATSQVKDALYWSGGEPAEDLLQEVALRLIVLLLVKNVVILSVALKCHSCSSARYQPASPCADKTPCSWQRRTTSGTEYRRQTKALPSTPMSCLSCGLPISRLTFSRRTSESP